MKYTLSKEVEESQMNKIQMKWLFVFIQRHFRPKLKFILGHTCSFCCRLRIPYSTGLEIWILKKNPSFNYFPQGEFIHFGDRILHCSVLTSVCVVVLHRLNHCHSSFLLSVCFMAFFSLASMAALVVFLLSSLLMAMHSLLVLLNIIISLQLCVRMSHFICAGID